MFRQLNDPVARFIRRFYYVEKGEYAQFDFPEKKIYMDVNTLDVFECEEKNLPKPVVIVPQFDCIPNRRLRMLCLNVTHACQLRCDYCYLKHFYADEYGRAQSMMSFDTAKRAIETLFDWKLIDKLPDPRLRIGFFGGEPLLNFSLVKQVVEEYGPSGKFKFEMTSNIAAMTEEIAQFLAKYNFSMVISLDGSQEYYDLHRKAVDGASVFDKVMAGLTMLKRAGVKRITLRGTFLPDKVDLVERVKFLNSLCDEGYANGVSVEPACLTEGCGAAVPHELKFTSESVAALESEYLQLADWLVERLNNGQAARFHNIIVFLKRLVNRTPYATQCGAGMGYMAVSPDGTVYGCHREMSSKIGELELGGVDERARHKWVDNRHYQFSACMACSFRNICGGPCREHNITSTGCISKVDPIFCQFYQMWIKSAVSILDKTPLAKLKQVYEEKPKAGLVARKLSGKVKYAFVREGGGIGDIVSMGGAAIQVKEENPEAEISFLVPSEYVEIAQHLVGVDHVVDLGPISSTRRPKGTPIDLTVHGHLAKALTPGCILADMWCPGLVYEMNTPGRLEFTRSQVFAKAAGCKSVSKALPVWNTTVNERKAACGYMKKFDESKLVVGFAPRGSQINKSMPDSLVDAIVETLSAYQVLYFDVSFPARLASRKYVTHVQTDFISAAAILEQCDTLISVDTSFLHVGAALQVPTLGVFTLNDVQPYKLFYPNLVIVSKDEGIAQCQMPCNRSPHKQYVEKCQTEGCVRRNMVSINDVIVKLPEVFRIAHSPEFIRDKIARLTRR
jgi:uncharacterized protein